MFRYAIVILAGCSTTVTRTSADIYAYAMEENDQVALHDVEIDFRDPDGTSRSTTTDADGHAHGEIAADGSVWEFRDTAMTFQSNLIAAYDGIPPNDTYVFGPPAVGPHARVMRVHADPPSGNVSVGRFGSCAIRDQSDVELLRIADDCGATVDILVVATTDIGTPSLYAYLPAQPIVDGGSVTFAPTDWKPLDSVSVHLTNLDGAVVAMQELSSIGSSMGFAAYASASAPDTVTAKVPLVGSDFELVVSLVRGGAPQMIFTHVPATAAQDVDISKLAAPWVTVDVASGTSWSEDDEGGALRADAMLTHHRWTQPIANFTEANDLRIISPPGPPGEIPIPQLPTPIAKEQPGPDFQIERSVLLFRFDGDPTVDPFRLTELITRASLGTLRFDVPSTVRSFAMSGSR